MKERKKGKGKKRKIRKHRLLFIRILIGISFSCPTKQST